MTGLNGRMLHTIFGHTVVWGLSMIYPICEEITNISLVSLNQCVTPLVTFIAKEKEFLLRN